MMRSEGICIPYGHHYIMAVVHGHIFRDWRDELTIIGAWVHPTYVRITYN